MSHKIEMPRVWGNFPRPFVMSLSLKSVRIYLIQTKKDYIDGKNKNTPQRKAQRRTLNPMQIYAVDANLPWCIQVDSLPCSCFILQVKAMETFRHAFSLIPLIDTKISNNTRSLNQIGQNKYYETGQQCNSKVVYLDIDQIQYMTCGSHKFDSYSADLKF